MRSLMINHYISKAQETIYNGLNNASRDSQILGHLGSLPVALLDVGLETLKSPLHVIENIAFSAINLIGSLFSEKCSIKESLFLFEGALSGVGNSVIGVVVSPLKLLYQIFSINYNLGNAESFNPFNKHVTNAQFSKPIQ